jgi:hypothetical protein
MSDAGKAINIHSDLDIQAGSRHARLLANGTHLRLITDDPAGFLTESSHALRSATAGSSSVRLVIAQTAAALDQAGLSAEVASPRGTLIELGRGRGSSVGRLATGSPHVRLGNPVALVSLVGRSKWIVGAAPVILIGVLRLKTRRHRAP